MDSILFKNGTQKMHIIVAHDQTLAIILWGLGYETKHTPPFASTIIFELHQNDTSGDYYVKTFYNDKLITFGLCSETECDYTLFKKSIHTRMIPDDVNKICEYDETVVSMSDLFEVSQFEHATSMWYDG